MSMYERERTNDVGRALAAVLAALEAVVVSVVSSMTGRLKLTRGSTR
jgi:hypothetical protein